MAFALKDVFQDGKAYSVNHVSLFHLMCICSSASYSTNFILPFYESIQSMVKP